MKKPTEGYRLHINDIIKTINQDVMKTKTIEYESPKTTVLALVNLSPLMEGSTRAYPLSSSEAFDDEFESIGW